MSTIETPSVPTDYTWSFPGSPIQIRLRLAMVNDLQTVLDGHQRLKGLEAHAGGVLRGSIARPGITEISGFEALPALAMAKLEEMCMLEPDIVGFYRTTDKGGLRMSDQDQRLAHSRFSRPGSVVLLIETDESGPSNAAFFFWDEGKIHGDFALMEFPFDAYQLAAAEQRRGDFAKISAPQSSSSNPSSHRALWGTQIAGIVIGGVLLAAAIAGGLRLVREPRGTAAPRVERAAATPSVTGLGALGLSLDQQGSKLRVYWNREAPTIVSAKFGMVVIREGGKSRNVALTQDQLRSGSILYAPKSDQVEIELNVVGGERVSRESITALLPSRGAENPVIASAQAVEPPRKLEPTADETEATDEPPEKPELRKFSLPAASRRVAAAGPSAITDLPPAVKLDSGVGALPAAVAWQSSALPAPRPAAPVPSPARPEAAPAAPAVTTESGAPIVPEPPVAVHKAAPRFSPEMKSVLTKPTTVQVLAKIDATGRVTDVTPAGNQKVHLLLLQAALDAARAWTFRPATVRGKPVPAEMLMKFDFTPTR